MVFDLNMCGKCLHDALDTLGYYREMAEDKGISLLAITGIKDKREESEIIGLHHSGALFFPVKIMKKTDLFGALKITEPDLIDTPFFFYLDKDFRVLDVFKPGYLKTSGWKNLFFRHSCSTWAMTSLLRCYRKVIRAGIGMSISTIWMG